MRIHFDEKNLLADMVGKANGITRAELERSQSKALKALATFRKRADGGAYGFPQLPFASGVIQSIRKFADQVKGGFDTVCVVGIGGPHIRGLNTRGGFDLGNRKREIYRRRPCPPC